MSPLQHVPTAEDLKAAQARIAAYIHRTPVFQSQKFDNKSGASIIFKGEHLQKTGAFKARGAMNAVLINQEHAKGRGFVTHSSGNHGAALAWAASNIGEKAHIIMPSNAPKAKIEAVRSYGGIIEFCAPTLDAREQTAKAVEEKEGAFFVHPYDNYDIIAGQATATMELLEEHPDLKYLFVPVGGGGLLSGAALANAYFGSGKSSLVKQEPKEDWLSFVKTGKAKQRIKQSLKKEKQLITGQGQFILERKLKVLKLKATHSNIHKLVNFFGLKNPEELYYKVGLGVIDNGKLREYARETSGLVNYFKQRIVRSNYAKTKLGDKSKKQQTDHLLLVFDTDEHEMDYTLAKCCNPLPGDRVFGFVTTADGLKVHRDDCPNAVLLQSRFANRTLKAKWVDRKGAFSTINLLIKGMDRIGIVNDVTKVVSNELSINIKAIAFSVDDGLFTGKLTIEVADKLGLTDTINNIKNLEGISSVTRVGKFN